MYYNGNATLPRQSKNVMIEGNHQTKIIDHLTQLN